MSTCIFCKIVAGNEPASIVYQDDIMHIIMDAYPLSEGHCLIIPNRHVQRLHELEDAERTQLFELGHRAMQALQACGFGRDGINLLLNDGKAANQTVPHLHLHVIPRKKGDLFSALPKLALHVTGVFGIKTRRDKRDALAQQLRGYF